MKKIAVHLVLIFSFMACKNDTPPSQSVETFTEAENPVAADSSSWAKVPDGLQVAFGTIDRRYPKEQVPAVEGRTSWARRAWRGERVHAQLVLWTADDVDNVQVKLSDLTTQNDQKIAKEALQARFVRYVMTDEFGKGCGYRTEADYDSSLVADMLDPLPDMDLQGQTVRPVWLTINIPQEASPGQYQGTVEVRAEGESIQTLNINLEVSPMKLPPPEQWSFHLDLWQNPFAVARYNDVPLWSDEHWALLRPLLEMLDNAGQKSITVSVLDQPWGGQTYDPFKAMVKWTRHKDGSWSYDYSVFDQWVSFVQDVGITEQINVYSMIPWGNKFRYFDEEKGAYVTKKMKPGTEEYDAHWRPFLKDFAKHLKKKGWFKRTNIAMDERPMEAMKAALELIQEVEPNFRVALAGKYHKEIASEIYDLSFILGQDIPDQVIRKRNKANKITTFYTSCAHEKPNTFTFSKPAYASWYAWYAAAHNLSGYLRWAYNSWVKNPLKDSRFRTWPAGDTYLVYPGARSSIRFERLREGIQDYEKIRILKEKLKRENTPQSKKQLQRLQETLDNFEIEQLDQKKAGQMIRHGREVLRSIEKYLTD